jgi:hypothetical protein
MSESGSESEDLELNPGFSFEATSEPTRSWDYSFAIPHGERKEIAAQLEKRKVRVRPSIAAASFSGFSLT